MKVLALESLLSLKFVLLIGDPLDVFTLFVRLDGLKTVDHMHQSAPSLTQEVRPSRAAATLQA